VFYCGARVLAQEPRTLEWRFYAARSFEAGWKQCVFTLLILKENVTYSSMFSSHIE
ncbi:hypothetical protein KI387_012450, partial [Taxus chinensis]